MRDSCRGMIAINWTLNELKLGLQRGWRNKSSAWHRISNHDKDPGSVKMNMVRKEKTR